MKKDVSYGIIPIKQFPEGWKVLVINQFSRIGNNSYWVFPKGHPEGDESPLETAKRELYEETGLEPKKLIEDPSFQMQYRFKFEEQTIDKTVEFFIGVIDKGELELGPAEVLEARWFNLELAPKRLSYNNTKKMFREATEYIKRL
jgi:8-oxo-dGTP pyrophosphatase MutT (NUDIX family)